MSRRGSRRGEARMSAEVVLAAAMPARHRRRLRARMAFGAYPPACVALPDCRLHLRRTHDYWLCPEGEHLWPHELDPELRLVRYRARAHVCNGCAVKHRCTDSDRAERSSVRSTPGPTPRPAASTARSRSCSSAERADPPRRARPPPSVAELGLCRDARCCRLRGPLASPRPARTPRGLPRRRRRGRWGWAARHAARAGDAPTRTGAGPSKQCVELHDQDQVRPRCGIRVSSRRFDHDGYTIRAESPVTGRRA